MTNDELRGKVKLLIEADSQYLYDELVDLITQQRHQAVRECLERLRTIAIAEPCEENCNQVRHAYHEGQWLLDRRIDAWIDYELKKLGEEK